MDGGHLKKCECGKLHSGFTLIELLVVIAIIALMLAVLMPALRKAGAVSKQMTCQSNLKILAYAWSMYLEHNDGYFYQGVNANLNYGGWKGIVDWSPRPLNRFVGLAETLEDEGPAKVFCCPTDTGGVPGLMPREKAFRYRGTSYQTNIFLIGQDMYGPFSIRTQDLDVGISDRLKHLNISQVTTSPAHLVLIGDQAWMYHWLPMPPPVILIWEQFWKPYGEWHGKPDRYNLAFLDCHISFVKIRKAYYVTDDYSIVPFKDLYQLAYQVQGEGP
jgi:prepilin-type N-terminal cleavage/methylation domain-containing protein